MVKCFKWMYEINYTENELIINFYFKSNLLFYKVFEKYCEGVTYDWNTICLVGILHCNICTLYDNFQGGRYGEFLFLLGKLMLTKHLKGDEVI